MAPGSNKDLGSFWIGTRTARQIVLCESAIDAISCFQIYPQRICISTSGVRTNPPWLSLLIAHGYAILCGFDADHPGDAAAAHMIALHPTIRRLRPSAHDWNDVLTSYR
jgi:DNA primase